MPIVRVTLDHMREEILHATARHNQDLEDEIGRQLGAALSDESFQRLIATEIEVALREHVKRAVRECFLGLRYDDAAFKQVTQLLVDSMRRNLEPPQA